MKTARTILLITFVVLVNAFTLSLLAPFFIPGEIPEFVGVVGLIAWCVAILLSLVCIVIAAVGHSTTAADPTGQKNLGFPILAYKLLMIPYFVVAFVILQLIPLVDVISYCCIAFYFRVREKDRRLAQ